MLLTQLHEIPQVSENQTILRGEAAITGECDDYIMIVFDISQCSAIICKNYPDEDSANNAPQDVYYEDNGGKHHFVKCASRNTVVNWVKE